VLGTGAEWDLLQVFAWGRMFVTHARTMSVSAAVHKTFDGEMCGICRLVDNAKKQEQSRSNSPDLKVQTKILLVSEAPAPVVIEVPDEGARRLAPSLTPSQFRSAPPVPPPRQAIA